jgi:hypothetical protein
MPTASNAASQQGAELPSDELLSRRLGTGTQGHIVQGHIVQEHIVQGPIGHDSYRLRDEYSKKKSSGTAQTRTLRHGFTSKSFCLVLQYIRIQKCHYCT